MCTFFCFFFCEQKKQKKVPKKKKKRRSVFYVFAEVLPQLSRVFCSAKAESFFVRYCATHMLTNCRALFEVQCTEFARLKRLDVVQNVSWAYLPNKNSAERSEDDVNSSVFFLFFCTFFWDKYFNLEYQP